MASSTIIPIDQEPVPGLNSSASEKHAVALKPPSKEPREIECLEVVARPLGDSMANAPVVTRAMHRKALIQFAVLCTASFVGGWGDGVISPLVPRLLEAYHVEYSVLSISLSMVPVGMVFGSVIFQFLMDRIGFGVLSVTASTMIAIGNALQASAAPFPAFVVGSFLMGVGNAFLIGSTAFVASQAGDRTAKIMILSATTGLGATCAPLAATQFARMPRWWSLAYAIGVAFAVITGICQAFTFRFKAQDECLKEVGERPLEKTEDSLKGVSKYKQILRMPAIYLMAFFMFASAGSQATMYDWMVTFLVKERRGGPNSGYVSSGMSGANTIGPLALILLSKKLGGWRAVFLYTFLALALEFVVWFTPSLIVDAVSLSLLELFRGPIGPLVTTHLRLITPPELISGAISWLIVFATIGSTASVFISGTIATRMGITNFHIVVVTLLGFMLIIWVFVPKHRAQLNG